MYTLIENNDYCENYMVRGGVVGEHYLRRCIIDGEDLHYDPVITLKSDSNSFFCIRLSNSDDFVKMAQEGLFNLREENLTKKYKVKDLSLLAECVDKLSSKLKNIKIKEKEDYCLIKYQNREILLFSKIGISRDLINEEFNLKNFFKERNNYAGTCDYCDHSKRNYFSDGRYHICDNCFDKINLKCAKIGENNKLKNKLIIKNI